VTQVSGGGKGAEELLVLIGHSNLFIRRGGCGKDKTTVINRLRLIAVKY